MLNHQWKKITGIAALALFASLVLSISSPAAESNSEGVNQKKRIAVVPFQSISSQGDIKGTVFCPVCGIGASTGKVLEGSEKIVEETFIDRLSKLKDINLIPDEKVQSVYNRISSEKLKGTMVENFKKTGKELGADYLATGYVYRYMERVGYKYSTEHPASVAFELHLIKTSDGSIVWRGLFDKTQKSLMEDVFQASSFFKGGAKWVTARQLAEMGMDDAFKTFPDLEN